MWDIKEEWGEEEKRNAERERGGIHNSKSIFTPAPTCIVSILLLSEKGKM